MTPTTQPEIGILIRSLRRDLGLTQEKIAAKLGVTFPTVNLGKTTMPPPHPWHWKRLKHWRNG